MLRRSSADPDTLRKVRSLFSLKCDDQSLRLETWGPWILFEDSANQRQYWYNQLTQQGADEEPEEVRAMKLRQTASTKQLLSKVTSVSCFLSVDHTSCRKSR
jgi:hypothetical protein